MNLDCMEVSLFGLLKEWRLLFGLSQAETANIAAASLSKFLRERFIFQVAFSGGANYTGTDFQVACSSADKAT